MCSSDLTLGIHRFGVRRGSDVQRWVDVVLNLTVGECVSVQGDDHLAGARGELHPPGALHHALVEPKAGLACWAVVGTGAARDHLGFSTAYE